MDNPTAARLDDLCRTERYFTSALLTGLFFEDNLRGVDEFFRWLIENKQLTLARVDDGKLVRPTGIDTSGHVEVLTEFNIKRELRCYHPGQLANLITDINDCDDTLDVTDGQSVPDVILLADDTLLVIEGKFFVADQSPAKINKQLRSQKEEIELMVRHLAPRIQHTCHVYLSPEVELDPEVYDCDLVLSWEDIYAFACELVGAEHYISRRLATANARYRASQVGSTGGGINYAKQCNFAEAIRACQEHGDEIVVGFQGGVHKLISSTESYLRRRKYKLDSATDGTGKKKSSNWLPGDQFHDIARRICSGDPETPSPTSVGPTVRKRTKNYKDTCTFDELIEMCRKNGQNILIGFSGGKSQLRASSPSYLRDRTYKWDDAKDTRGKKSRSNWIRGDEFLRTVGRHADSV